MGVAVAWYPMRYSNHAANPASLAVEISLALGCRFKRFWYKVVAVKLEPVSELNRPVTVTGAGPKVRQRCRELGVAGRGARGRLVRRHHREVVLKASGLVRNESRHLSQARAARPGPEREARRVGVAAQELFVQRIDLTVDLAVARS